MDPHPPVPARRKNNKPWVTRRGGERVHKIRESAAMSEVGVWQELAVVTACIVAFAGVCMLESLSD